MAETTLPSATALVEIDWCKPDVAPVGWPIMATCDLCSATATDDFMDRREPRQFLRQHGGLGDGLTVCEHCLERYLTEETA